MIRLSGADRPAPRRSSALGALAGLHARRDLGQRSAAGSRRRSAASSGIGLGAASSATSQLGQFAAATRRRGGHRLHRRPDHGDRDAPPGGGAAGHSGVVLLFTNTSTDDLRLIGYPGVDGLDSSGHDVASATRTLNGMIGFCGCTKPATLTLKPGDVVSAVTEGGRGRVGRRCAPVRVDLLVDPAEHVDRRPR